MAAPENEQEQTQVTEEQSEDEKQLTESELEEVVGGFLPGSDGPPPTYNLNATSTVQHIANNPGMDLAPNE